MSTEEETTPVFKKDVVTRKKMASYTMGPFFETIITSSYNVLIFYYYEVELGLSIALVGLSFVIFAIWNMINDPLIGYLTDKPMRWSRKYGMRPPWVIIGGSLTIICFYFLFAVPDLGDVKSNPWPLFWYMVIITCLFDTFFSIYTTHYIGSFANIFRTTEERRKGSIMATFMALMGGGMATQAILMPLLIVYGDPSSYVRYGLISSIVLVVALIAFQPGVHENEFVKKRYFQIYEFLQTQKMPYSQFLKAAFKAKNYRTWVFCLAITQMAVVLNSASLLYFVKDVLKADIQALAPVYLATLVTFVPSVFFWGWIAKKRAHSDIIIIGWVLMSVSYMMSMFVQSIEQLIILSAFGGFAFAPFVTMIFSLNSDTIDEVNLAAGRHVEAGTVGITFFFIRISFIAVGVIITGIHLATGYVPGAETQTPLAILGVRIHRGFFPSIFCILAIIIMLKYFNLKEEKLEEVKAAMRKMGL